MVLLIQLDFNWLYSLNILLTYTYQTVQVRCERAMSYLNMVKSFPKSHVLAVRSEDRPRRKSVFAPEV